MEQFSLKTEIYTGAARLCPLLKGAERVLVVTDDFMVRSGKTDYVTGQLEEAGITYAIFSEVHADPDLETVTRGIAMLEEFAPRAVVAFGGGSSIDAAKGMLFFAVRHSGRDFGPLIAIPTTSGTGSEVSRFTVIRDAKADAKYPLVDASLVPDAAILDASLTVSVPPEVTADTGLDVFTHALEAYMSKNAGDFTDALAEKALRLVKEHLLSVYRHPEDQQARQQMHHASCLAGMAFSAAGLGLNHSMAHTLGAHFHLPHGRANGILLPYVISYNAGGRETHIAGRYAGVAALLGKGGTAGLIRLTRQYQRQLGIPESIAAAGIPRTEFDRCLEAMIASALEDGCTSTNPRAVSEEDIRTVFEHAYAGTVLTFS